MEFIKAGMSAPRIKAGQFKTSQDYYNLAVDKGLQDRADTLVSRNSGEEYKQLWSGGFISDVFDAMSLGSYGMVGLLKGKSFKEGLDNRESFSDKDSLGQYGLVGSVAGVVLDTLVDPLTYIAPWTVLKNVPGVVRVMDAAKTYTMGEKLAIKYGTGKEFIEREGGVAKAMAVFEKISYEARFTDPVQKEIWERGQLNQAKGTTEINKLFASFSKLDKSSLEKMVSFDDTGRLNRLDEVNFKKLDKDLQDKIRPAYEKIDELGAELVDLGILSKSDYEKGLGDYLHAEYDKYLNATKPKFGAKASGVKGVKDRVNLTPEQMKELGQIQNPAYLLISTITKMHKDVVQGRMLKEFSDKFGVNSLDEVPEEYQKYFTQVPETRRFATNSGKMKEETKRLDLLNEDLKKTTKEFTKTKKMDKKVSAAIKSFNTTAQLHGERTVNALNKLSDLGSRTIDDVEFDGVKKLKMSDSPAGGIISKIKDDTVPAAETRTMRADQALKTGVVGKKDVKEMIRPKSTEVVSNELKMIRKKITDYNTGFKAGKKLTMKEINDTQSEVIDMVTRNFEMADRGKYLRAVKNATSMKQMDKLTARLEKDFNKLKQDSIDKLGEDLLSEAKKNYSIAMKAIQKSADLTDIEKASITDSLNMTMKKIENFKIEKELIRERIEINKLGQLSGKFVPKRIMDMVDEAIEPDTGTLGKNIMAEFKFAHVVLSPAAHVRNVLSNLTLNYWKLGLGPKDLHLYMKAGAELASSTESPMLKEARSLGLGVSSHSAEIKQLLEDPSLKISGIPKRTYRKMQEKIGAVYAWEEETAKYAAFMFNKNRGMSSDEAWKMAEEATFNYAQVTPFVRKLRTSLFGAPFITFAIKSAPETAKAVLGVGTGIGTKGTLITSTARVAVFDKFRRAIESQSDEEETAREKEEMPDYIKNGFYFKLPFKDEHNRSVYFDATYILPFSTLYSNIDTVAKIAKGDYIPPERLADEAAGMLPFFQIVKQLTSNQDFYGNKITLDTATAGEQALDYSTFLAKQMMPPQIAANTPSGYDKFTGEELGGNFMKSLREGDSPDPETFKQMRTSEQELWSYLGMKVRPFDEEVQSASNEYAQRQALQQMLTERGFLGNFSYEKKLEEK